MGKDGFVYIMGTFLQRICSPCPSLFTGFFDQNEDLIETD
jgi:hypothetical protein